MDDGFDLETSSDVEESIQTRTELITVVRICINTDIPTGTITRTIRYTSCTAIKRTLFFFYYISMYPCV